MFWNPIQAAVFHLLYLSLFSLFLWRESLSSCTHTPSLVLRFSSKDLSLDALRTAVSWFQQGFMAVSPKTSKCISFRGVYLCARGQQGDTFWSRPKSSPKTWKSDRQVVQLGNFRFWHEESYWILAHWLAMCIVSFQTFHVVFREPSYSYHWLTTRTLSCQWQHNQLLMVAVIDFQFWQ